MENLIRWQLWMEGRKKKLETASPRISLQIVEKDNSAKETLASRKLLTGLDEIQISLAK